MRRSNVLVPLDRTMQFPLTLAGGLRTTFADVVSSPLPDRLTALTRLQSDPRRSSTSRLAAASSRGSSPRGFRASASVNFRPVSVRGSRSTC